MAALQMIPDTRGGRTYRRFLLIAGILSIVGVADQLRAFLGLLVFGPSTPGADAARILIMFLGWVMIGWCAVRAIRLNALPPAWAVLSIPALIWAYILWPG